MKTNIKVIDHREIKKILQEFDNRIVFEKTNVIPEESDLYDELEHYIGYDEIGNKSILGMDIFQYTSYGEIEQTMLPFVFSTLFNMTIQLCLKNHRYIFQKYSEEKIKEDFISTGDGGFLVLDSPLHSLVFASNLAVILRIFNSFHFYPKLRKIVGPIKLRYAITYDKIYTYESNFYGRAVINNSRILVKDNLTRCLIDENVYSWFEMNIDGLENLQVLTITDLANIFEFKKEYDPKYLKTSTDEIFEDEPSRKYGIINSDILEIGKIKSKEAVMNIYNLHLQVTLNLYNDDIENQSRTITVSLGNLNTAGI